MPEPIDAAMVRPNLLLHAKRVEKTSITHRYIKNYLISKNLPTTYFPVPKAGVYWQRAKPTLQEAADGGRLLLIRKKK